MAVELYANNAATVVTSGGTTATGGTETWTVASPGVFPAASASATPPTQFRVVDPAANGEKILVTNVSGSTWTVTRGAEGSAPIAHAPGFTVVQALTAASYAGFLQVQTYGGVFGDGSDGAAALDGSASVAWASKSGSVYTLTRGCYCTTLSISSGVTLIPAGFPLFASTSITNGGTVRFNGNNASGATGGAANYGTSLFIGGQAGASGDIGPGVQATVSGIRTGTGASGAGGSGSSGSGGGGRTQNGPVSAYRQPGPALAGVITWNQLSGPIAGSAGGGSGAGDGTNQGGGGGGGGGLIVMFAPLITNNGTISANGGNGGTPGAGNCGGGGGGGGGVILPYTLSAWTAGTTSVTGGTGGAATGTGTSGANGGGGSVLNVVLI